MTYVEYINSQKDAIKELEKSRLSFPLDKTYSPTQIDKLKSLENIKNLFKDIKDLSINRLMIYKSFKKDIYKGFVLTLLWGGYGTGHTSFDSLIEIFNIDKKIVRKKLLYVKRQIRNKNIKDVFISMMNGNDEVKIKGIGQSYFTKLLHFMYGDCHKLSEDQPLIYDSWAQKIHVALLLNEGNNINLYGFLSVLGNDKDYCITWDLYDDYVKRINRLSRKLELKSAGVLEEFLFGKLPPTFIFQTQNPREFLMSYLKRKYNESRTASNSTL